MKSFSELRSGKRTIPLFEAFLLSFEFSYASWSISRLVNEWYSFMGGSFSQWTCSPLSYLFILSAGEQSELFPWTHLEEGFPDWRLDDHVFWHRSESVANYAPEQVHHLVDHVEHAAACMKRGYQGI